MNKFMTIFKHTFLTNLKKKSFIITTIVSMVLIVLLFNLPPLLEKLSDDKSYTIGVVDQTHEIYSDMKSELSLYEKIELKSFASEDSAQKAYNDGDIYGYVIVKLNANNFIEAEYKAENIVAFELSANIEQSLSTIQFHRIAKELNLSSAEINSLFTPVKLTKTPLGEDAKSESDIALSYVIVYILLIAIYFGVIMYGNMVAMEVAKEKSSRIMEILVSSVNLITQMFGKILGISLLGILQISLMFLIGFFSLKSNSGTFTFDALTLDFSNIPLSLILYGVLFYLLGYLFYATLAAMLGSLVSRIEDMQQTIGILNFVMVAAFLVSIFGLTNPDALVIKISSYIPFFTPMIMFMRIGMTNIHFLEIAIGILIMIVSIIASSIFAAKVYKGGVLLYGKSNSLKDIRKALELK